MFSRGQHRKPLAPDASARPWAWLKVRATADSAFRRAPQAGGIIGGTTARQSMRTLAVSGSQRLLGCRESAPESSSTGSTPAQKNTQPARSGGFLFPEVPQPARRGGMLAGIGRNPAALRVTVT